MSREGKRDDDSLVAWFSRSLGTKFAGVIFGVVLLTTAVLGWFSYTSTRDALRDQVVGKLEAVREDKAQQVVQHLWNVRARVSTLSREPEVTEALPRLLAYLHPGPGGAGGQYDVSSPGYQELYRRLQAGFSNRLAITTEAHNVYLISADDGLVMFNLSGEKDLGTNLGTGPYRDSALARTWSQVVKTRKAVVTDFSHYEPSPEPTMFIGAPVYDDSDRLAAVVVEQFSAKGLTELLQQKAGFGNTGEVFLIGEDKLLRSKLRDEPNAAVLGKEIDTNIVRDVFAGRLGTRSYLDYRGVSVLATARMLGLKEALGTDFDWAIIAKQDQTEAFAPLAEYTRRFAMVMTAALALALLVGIVLARTVAKRVTSLAKVADAIAKGNLETPIAVPGRDEVSRLAESIRRMQAGLRDTKERTRQTDWLKGGLARLNDAMRGVDDEKRLAEKAIAELCNHLGAEVGLLYVAEDEGADAGTLGLVGSYASKGQQGAPARFNPGEGLVGQAALDRKPIVVTDPPKDYIRVVSGLGDTVPRQICVAPFLFEDRVRGVVEIATLGELDAMHLDYLGQAAHVLGVSFETAMGRSRLARELERSQALSAQLQVQQEELRVTNEELEQQAQALSVSEQKLRAQQEELRVSNEELTQKNELLVRQTREVEAARQNLAEKAEELAVASKYKSEFLANMSHELRTPLNSLLLLARGFVDNKDGNLTDDQVASARVIHDAGNDLLSLINEILDLAKIESGRMDLVRSRVSLQELGTVIEQAFGHMAKAQGLALGVEIEPGLPGAIETDAKRLQQVVKNLVSNALKFTHEGGVTVRFHRPAAGTDLSRSGLDAKQSLAISVTDTGIGIAPEHQKLVFEAFRQVDGGTSRKYGGTGLGLSISRELARILGGELTLVSGTGKGSTFTIYLPFAAPAPSAPVSDAGTKRAPAVVAAPGPQSAGAPPRPLGLVPDDRDKVTESDRVILVVEDDLSFAKILAAQCRNKGFKCLVATSGEEGLELAQRHVPRAVLLDLNLPGIDGWQVLEAMKADTRTRHIPVHVVSVEGPTVELMRRGAIGHLRKPATPESLEKALSMLEEVSSRSAKRLLIVEDDEQMRRHIVELLKDKNVQVDEASSSQQVIEALVRTHYDCLILDLGLWDMDGDDLLRTLSRDHGLDLPPVIIHTARELTREEEARLREYTDSIVVKDVRSDTRLLDEVSLFLHRAVADMPPRQQRIIKDLHGSDAVLEGKRVLLADDDMRSAFALTKLLAERGMQVVKAENGEKALKVLFEGPSVDLVLMDIMMPVMDGYEAIRRIRAEERFARLPIIALTAKAMSGDRDKCLAAGADDYQTKPIDPERLISMMRVWLSR